MSRITAMSPEGRDWLAKMEGGYRTEPYLCPAGVWTISAGVTRWPTGARVKQSDRFPAGQEAREARKLFASALRQYERATDALTRDDIEQHHFDALCSFVFNVGPAQASSSTLFKVVNARGPLETIVAQWRRWHYADGKPKVLTSRREAEILAYARGVYLDQAQAMRRPWAPPVGKA